MIRCYARRNVELQISSFSGIVVGQYDILFKYTHYGDADINGYVDGDDFVYTDSQIGMPGDWSSGDFDYNGISGTSNDYAWLEYGFALQGSPL